MNRFSMRALSALVFVAALAPAMAQSWTLKGHGVGLYVGNAPDYDKTLRVVKTGDSWNLQSLSEMGAFNANGPNAFGAWIQGPPTDSFKNASGTPAFLYKVRVTDPKGAVRSYGDYNFYAPGFAVFFLADVQSGVKGTWRVDWYTVHRDTKAEKLVASDTFAMGDQAPPATAAANPADARNVGLYDGSRPDYDTVLQEVKTGASWSLKALYEMGAFRQNGPNVFGAWYRGPHTDTFKNANGIPIYLYKVRVTNPKGETRTYGDYGFYAPGFAVYFLADVQNGMTGTWRVDWYTVHRDTKAEKLVQTSAFEMTP